MKNKFVVFLVLWISVVEARIYNQNPIISTEDGNLEIWSAEDKNITISNMGRGTVMINGIDVLQFFHGDYSNSTSRNLNPLLNVKEVYTQLSRMRSWIRGKNGIIARLEQLENGTSTRGGGGGGGRQIGTRFGYRLSRLEEKVNMLSEKLMRDNCRSHPCQNGGTCFSMFETFKCECPKNWEGPTCGQDVNECAQFAGTDLGCQNGADCINKPGSYECRCKDSWQGLHCTKRKADCLSQTSSELCGHGTCIQTNDKDGYTCICEQGWTKGENSPACVVDIDECTAMKPHCSKDPEVPCINLQGSFMCGPCPPGYTGNGFYCADVNECEVNNGGCSISPSVQCINTRGSFHCGSCPQGFEGDGRVCRVSNVTPNVNTCSPSDQSLCSPNAVCIQYPNSSPICRCNLGYTGSGIGPNGCAPATMNPCLNLRCRNGGTCIPNGPVAHCQCLPGYIQPFCDPTADPCSANPCLNGGTCSRIGMSPTYNCSCPEGFQGIRCELQKRVCGGVYALESGNIKFPVGSSRSYHANARCAWLIKTAPSKVLNVTFTQFDIEFSADCKYDWLQIHDGRSSASLLIGRFCGSNLPRGGNIISSHNNLYLWFRSDNSTAHDGFEINWESIDPICGGEIEVTSHGVITSPGSPGNYPPNRNCTWVLHAPEGSRIQFLFFILKIEAHETCSYDYLEIRSGTDLDGPLLGKYCNTTHPEPLLTPSNTATVYFHSDADSSDAGFQIAYSVREGIPGCGGIYTTSKGEISTLKKGDGTYHESRTCNYKIQLPVGSRIQIEFTKFSIEDSVECRFDSVSIFDGAENSKLIGKYCGFNIPPLIQSNTNTVLIKFVTDWSNQQEGFEMKYSILCGGVFSNETGTFSSPGYPKAYDGDQTCTYDIEAPLGKVIALEFIDFDMETHEDCEYDFVQIFDGHDKNSSSIGKFCSGDKPTELVSTFNVLHIVFNVDATIGGRGFLANYTFVDIDCGGILKNSNTVIRSPMEIGGDGVYKSNALCKWVIVAPPKHVIQINFLAFDLEEDSNCQYDYLKIFNNGSGRGEAIGPYCGTNIPSVINSIDNIVTIVFKTDQTTAKNGFTASLSFIEAEKLCGASYFSTYGIIKSPGSPEYLPNKNCAWIITVPAGRQIEINFKEVDIEPHAACRFDGLEVRNGGNELAPLIGLFCGNEKPAKIRSFGNQLYFRFYSDTSRNYKGFELEWDATSTGCGGILDSPRGSIISPGYPKGYHDNAQCDYRISVNQGSTIKIVFTDLDLESHTECRYDNLEVFDGIDSSGSSFGKFCNSENHPLHLETVGNHAFLRLTTDNSHGGRGFSLKYSINCNRTLTGFSGVLESPNFPNNYPNSMDCKWRIQVHQGNKVKIEFSHFEIENMNVITPNGSHVCQYDYLEVIDGSSKIQYCNEAPKSFISKNEYVDIMFHTDSSATAAGFRIEYGTEGCGGFLSHPYGSLSSPNYPRKYPGNIVCEWMIEVDFGVNIELTIHDLDIEGSENCEYDALVVALDSNYTNKLLSACSRKKDVVVPGSGHIMYVKFLSDISHAGKGFNATYRITALTGGCGGLYKSPSGFIYSPNYPKIYNPSQLCEWKIITDQSHSVVLRFMDFDLEKTDNCTRDYVEIQDAITKKSLWRGCDSHLPEKNYFKSEYNELSVVMKSSDGAVHAKGFKANFTTACGSRIVTNSTGTIRLQIDQYINDNCTWIIKSGDPTKKITLTVSYLYIQLSPDFQCETKLTIRDGETEDAPVKMEICGGKTPPAVISNGDAMRITLTVPDPTYYTVYEFDAHYSVLDNSCGGQLISENGEFASPSYPNTSPLNMFCTWEVVSSVGNVMQITVQSIKIVETLNCNDNYLEIRETDANGKLLGTFCGNQVPNQPIQGRGFWVRYRTDRFSVNGGFLAEFKYLSHNDLEGSQGIIESPLYPKYVLSNREQSYRISVAIGSVIRLEITDFFMGEEDQHCFSYIKIYDGYDNTAPLLIDETCHDPPAPLTSQTNNVYIEYLNNFYSASKFRMSWMELDKSSLKNETVNDCEHTVVLNEVNETVLISSPGYPNGYNHSLNCKWIISSGIQSMHPIVLIRDVDLEETTDCTADYVKFFTDRDDGSWKEIQKMCSFTFRLSLWISGTPNIKIEFVTDMNTNGTGFEVRAKLACGGVMTGPTGLISSDVSTAVNINMRDPISCMWNITVKSGRTIEFEFVQMNLPRDHNVCSSSVIIRNGIDATSPFLGIGQYCGINENHNISRTTSNRAFIAFTYKSNAVGSFKLKYREVAKECGGNIKLTFDSNSTIISSPNYPNIPDPHIECIWIIVAPVGESLRIDFIERFDLGPWTPCDEEYVELKDGSTSNARLIGTYCESAPPTQFTKGNVLRVKFFTEADNPHNGFKAKIALAKCGGTQKSSTGFIASPKYPGLGAYPSNSHCDYKVQGNFNTVFNISFIDLNLPQKVNGDCNREMDNVQIFSILPNINDTEDDVLSEIGMYCGNAQADPIITQTNEVLIRFNTFNPNSIYRGFKLRYSTGKLMCGGELKGESGELTSPGYPNQITIGYCEWKIEVPKGRRVKIQFLDLELMPGRNKFLQRLAFYNDFKHLNRIKFMTFDGDLTDVYSTDNKMMISFWVRYSSAHKGFKIRYSSDEPTLCQGDLNQAEGRITLPTNANLSSFVCEYLRDSRPIGRNMTEGTIVLNFENILFGRRVIHNCRYVSTVIQVSRSSVDSNDESSILSRICSNHTQLAIRSPYPDVRLLVKQSPFFGKINFNLTYKTHQCGGILTNGNTRIITNPIFGLSNYGPVDCAWLVEYASEYQILIQMKKIDLKLPCEQEYVKIYNGPTPMHPLIGTFCGNSASLNTLSLYKNLLIEFHSDAYGLQSMFEISTEPSATGCGGIINNFVNEIKSPVDNNQYPNNAECIWEIRADPGYHIGLKFTNRFFLEDSTNCTKDFLEIFDYLDDDWKSLGRVCGRKIPDIYNSTSDKMKLLFRSDATTSGEGFTVNWEQNCGGIIRVDGKRRTLVSPGYPAVYNSRLICNYTFISADPGKSVNVDFKDFELEYVQKCLYDNVTIYKEHEYSFFGDFDKIGTYCGTDSPGIVRAKNKVVVVFQTDRWVEKKGFMLEYSLDSCGSDIRTSQVISSPLQDGAYVGMLDCYWNITAPVGKKILIRFEMMNLEQSDQCYFDHIDVFGGSQPIEGNRLAKLCGNLTDTITIPVKNNSAVIHMKTDASNHFAGFSAAIFFVPQCDRDIELTETNSRYTLNMFDTNDLYSTVMECVYKISAPKMSTISVTFNEIHLSLCQPEKNRTKPCTCDYVEILDGNSPFSPLIGRYCGHSVPPDDITTSAGAMYMRFVTDSTLGSTGFKATFSMKDPICGPPYIDLRNKTSYELVSPGSPVYLPNLRCLWEFEAADFSMIEIIFEKFDLPESEKCSDNYLLIEDEVVKETITEGLGENFIYRGKSYRASNPSFYISIQSPSTPHIYCGSGIPHDYHSQSNKIHIRFQTSAENRTSGFKLRVNVASGCNRNYTSLQGRLQTNTMTNCVTHITVPQNYTVALYFARFILATDNCDSSYMKIYDGSLESGELLRTYCGYALPDPLFSRTNLITIKTHMEESSQMLYGGYDISYIATNKGRGCGGEMFNYGGTFSSPLYPNVSRANEDCTWTIMVPVNLKVAVKFNVFDMGSKITCESDYVEFIEDNDNDSETVVRKYCGEDEPNPYVSTKNKMRVRYKKTVNFSGTGWLAYFMGVTEGAIIGNW